jgi:hypothetical protein
LWQESLRYHGLSDLSALSALSVINLGQLQSTLEIGTRCLKQMREHNGCMRILAMVYKISICPRQSYLFLIVDGLVVF